MALLVALIPAPAPATPSDSPADPQVARLTADVARLTAEYGRRAGTAAAAAARLAGAFTAEPDPGGRAGPAAEQARARYATLLRDLYAAGGPSDPGLALLAGGPAEDLLWTIGLGRQVTEKLFAAGVRAEREASGAVAADRAAQERTDAARLRLARALADVRHEQDAAAQALEQAQGELTELRRVAAAAAAAAAARLAAAQATAAGQGLPGGTAAGALPVPPTFLAAYRSAARTQCPGLDWTLLAAVGQVESGHGRNDGPSSAGAVGPMQFLPATFAAYAVDGDGDGVTDPWDVADAVPTAARYLCDGADSGDPAQIRRALFRYNHAQWYVDLVLAAQRAIRAAFPN